MATQTGSTYISKSMTDIVNISKANLSFFYHKELEDSVSGRFNNDSQPEMAADTENTFIYEIMIEI